MLQRLYGRACRRPFLLNPLPNRRGAVLLLAVYLTVLSLLLFGTTLLVRIGTEVRAAERFRDQQAAFSLAEGALDVALRRLETESVADGTYTFQAPSPQGAATYRYTITTDSAEVLDPERQRLIRQITAEGISAGTQASSQVSAQIVEEGPLSGGWTEGPIWVDGVMGTTARGTLRGTLRSGLGIGWSVKLWRGLDLDGSVQIGLPNTTSIEYLNNSVSDTSPPYQSLVGTDVAGDPLYQPFCWQKCGVYLQGISGAVPQITNGTAFSASLKPIPTVTTYTNASPQCQGVLETSAIINDGDPQDLSNSQGPGLPDGKIELCFQYINAPTLTFNAPTTIYVTSSSVPLGFSYPVAFYAYDTTALDSSNQLIPNGVHIVATQASPGQQAGKIFLNSRRFSGSIYAPQSPIWVGPGSSPSGRQEFGKIVGREVRLWVHSNEVILDPRLITGGSSSGIGVPGGSGSSSTTPATSARVVSWTNQ